MNNYGIAKNALRDYLYKESKSREFLFQWLRAFYIVDNNINGSSVFQNWLGKLKMMRQNFLLIQGKIYMIL